MKIFLVGFMGCGKSSLGGEVARRAGLGFLDTDREAERIAGASIPEIFRTRGEEWFRELECHIIEGLPEGEDDIVVALGGGAVCREGVMEMLSEAGTTVYLKMSSESLFFRLAATERTKRPKIAGMDDAQLRDFIETSLAVRERFYELADIILECDPLTDEQIIEQILNLVKQ